ncbi:MAG TPA: PilT/PilU family type 4a pilus ATPase [Candidatus Baltobacteraceae bacterium]|nr:PilT/PilU family type 4a pilus ATPase [Candidatus Baltobacteraceae bacterium]
MTAALAPVRVSEVLRVARLRGASDVHLCAGVAPVFRVGGVLEEQPTVAPTEEEVNAVTASLLPARAMNTLASTGDATVTQHAGEAGSVRVHAYRTSRGTCLAIRLLATNIPSLESLQLPSVVSTFADKPHGLVIFAGPTGSGKSTSLAALVDRINRTQARHVMTIEDPIEYQHVSNRSLINQRELGRDVETFAEAIYGALRSDPDVILVGEMRDPQTMHAALTAAETGHLVLTTLHTGDAAQTVDRVVGVFNGDAQEQIRLQLAQTLVGVVCLRLVPRATGGGRRSAAEVLIASDAVRNVVRDRKTHQIRNIISTSRKSGMQTLEAHLSDLVARREITLDAARAVTERPDELRPSDRALT